MAEKLGERLEDMGRDLGTMIEEVNVANAGLSKATKADEPVCFKLYTRPVQNGRFANLSILLPPDHANRPHPQLPSQPTTSHRPRHRRSPGKSQCCAEGESGAELCRIEWKQ